MMLLLAQQAHQVYQYVSNIGSISYNRRMEFSKGNLVGGDKIFATVNWTGLVKFYRVVFPTGTLSLIADWNVRGLLSSGTASTSDQIRSFEE